MRIYRSEKVARWRKLVLHAALSAVLAVSCVVLPAAPAGVAASNERSLYLYYTHTGEKARITFKRNGRYVPSGLRKLNKFLGDWRSKQHTEMDPKLFDLVWEIYQDVRATRPIHVVSAYRSPKTNAMLRSRSRGVARNSRHTKGQAIDFFIPGVPTDKLRRAAMKKQFGGVGFYPTSASPFVHLDTGNVRAWPRMSRSELKRLFPSGRTLHLPRDGQPLSQKGLAYAAQQWRKCHRVPCRDGKDYHKNYQVPRASDIVVASAPKSPGVTDKPSLPEMLPAKPRAVQLIAQRVAGVESKTSDFFDTRNIATRLADAQNLASNPQIAQTSLSGIELPDLPTLPVRDAHRIQLATQRSVALENNLQLAGSSARDSRTFAQPKSNAQIGLRLSQTSIPSPDDVNKTDRDFAQSRILLSDQTRLVDTPQEDEQSFDNKPRLLMTAPETQLASMNAHVETNQAQDVNAHRLALANTFEALENGKDLKASKALEAYIKQSGSKSQILDLNQGLYQVDRDENVRIAAQPSNPNTFDTEEINNIILAAYAQIDMVETGSISAQELERIKQTQAQQAQFSTFGYHDLVAPDIEHVHEIYVSNERLHEARYAIMWLPDDGYVSSSTVYGEQTKKVLFTHSHLPGLSTTRFQKANAFSVAELN